MADIERLDALDFRTLTWSFPSRPISASVSRKSRPSNETTSESTLNDTIDAAVSGNCSMIKILAPRYSNKNKSKVYQMMHCKTTTCTIRLPEYGPYMAIKRGIPMTKVLGSVDREKMVIIHSRDPCRVRFVHRAKITSIMIF
uniref:Uncharacterized protein n=1 Tax=Opuntia streptacantha TaxID=393608 RepID=A0A7C9EYU0_OPUST